MKGKARTTDDDNAEAWEEYLRSRQLRTFISVVSSETSMRRYKFKNAIELDITLLWLTRLGACYAIAFSKVLARPKITRTLKPRSARRSSTIRT